ncbi:MAG: hypothetical protein K8I29_19650 [Alphaproteobacteria bacterium]|uniref:Uncharacterized protein n=1 Tax=Candidatus Nitrobium versatile TaxID=2884831 RepID=A0A953M3R7_9BACT|nr:hypothetical protein [Candidatus Nitrobium versatile]
MKETKTTHEKTKRINIRVSEKDLQQIRAIAEEEGLPYQTYIASLLHKHAAGRLVEKPKE